MEEIEGIKAARTPKRVPSHPRTTWQPRRLKITFSEFSYDNLMIYYNANYWLQMIPSDLNLRVIEMNSEDKDNNKPIRLKGELQRQYILQKGVL
jgi:hypothetical protein